MGGLLASWAPIWLQRYNSRRKLVRYALIVPGVSGGNWFLKALGLCNDMAGRQADKISNKYQSNDRCLGTAGNRTEERLTRENKLDLIEC